MHASGKCEFSKLNSSNVLFFKGQSDPHTAMHTSMDFTKINALYCLTRCWRTMHL